MAKDSSAKPREPIRTLPDEVEETLFKYYNKEAHKAAFELPTFARKALREALEKS